MKTLAREILEMVENNRLSHVFMKFPLDGMEWVQLSSNPLHLVLRTMKQEGGGEHWIPRITVEIHDGVLTDVRGPVYKKHHKYLLALLLHSSITGAKLGKKSDFHIPDFSPAIVDELNKKKPEICGEYVDPPRISSGDRQW